VNTFTAEVDEAVRAFQKDRRLKTDGLMTDNTLTWLLYGLSASDMDREYPLSDGRQVWVPTDGGTRFHTRVDCSGMTYARKLSLRNALALGFEPCSRCREK
jgi:peptidoglycan hydrolase-like protein with peptidoglycan-binding domain